MADLNIMPVFTDAYLADTTHLSREEHGSYLLLLMAMWRAGGRLKAETAFLMRVAKCTEKTWTKTWAVLEPLFTTEGEFITQKRLASEYSRAEEKVRQNKANASLGGKAKALNNNGIHLANANNSLEFRQSETAAESCPTVNRKPITEDRGGAFAPTPEKPTKGKRSRRAAEIPLPPAEGIPAAYGEYARSQGLEGAAIEREWRKFRDHAEQKDRRCAGERGWLAAWRGWITKAIEFSPAIVTNAAQAPLSRETLERTWRIYLERKRDGKALPQNVREEDIPPDFVRQWESQNGGLFQSGGPH